MAGIDEDQRPFQHLAPAQIGIDQLAPLRDHLLGRLGEAVAGHVDESEPKRLADVEEVELLGPSRRIRGSGEGAPVGESVEKRGLADVGAPGESHFRYARIGQEPEPRRRFQERDRPRKELARSLVQICLGFAHFAGTGVSDAAFIPG